MELLDIHNLEELQVILKSFQMITNTLGEELDRSSLLKSQLYRALAKHDVSTKLSEHNQLVELMKKGEHELVDEYMKSDIEISKLKHAWKYAEHALNTKKHMNNVMPKG
jgi:DNA-binding GntR family transcriptional regulator